jgi:hypothetical protein
MEWARKLAALLMLASTATQPAAGSALLASTLTLWFHEEPHAHSVSVVAEEGHLHLVLSHDEGADGDHGGAPKHDAPSCAARDHVFHMTDADAASATPRRVALDPARPIALAALLPSASPPPWASHSSPEPHARSSDLLRTAVLRL